MEDSTQPLRSQPASSAASVSGRRARAQSPARISQTPDSDTPKAFNASIWARAGACIRRAWRCGRGSGAGHRARTRSNSGSSVFDMRASTASQIAPKTADQIAAEKKLKQKIEKYSTMRVHMKRVQLRLEQEKRNRFYRELVIYLIFLVLVMSSLLSLPVHFPYEQNAAIDDLFFDEEFRNITIKKTFHDAMIEDEMWSWVDGPFVEGYYQMPIRNMRRIGSALVRTGRVKGDLCRYTDGRTDFVLFSNEFCYPEFSQTVEFRDDYGNDTTREVLGQVYTWDRGLSTLLRSQTFTPSLFNHEMDYGDGGYVIYLPRDNITAARTIIAQLKTDYVTDSTRYLAVTYAFYNPRSNIFTHVQALFEMSDTDYMETTSRVKSFHILRSYKDPGFFRDNWFVIVLTLATLWLLARELADLRAFGITKYIHSLWNMLDILQLVLLIIFIESWVSYQVLCENIRSKLYDVARRECAGPADDPASARQCFVDVEPLAWRFLSITNYASALALVSVAIVFKYLRLNTRLNLLWRTLRFAAKDLLAFVVIFFTIFFAYAIMGFLAFGSSVRQYHSLSVSLTSCFQMLLGAFDYNLIYVANPAMAGIFFFSFMISVYLICINMFIAIMSEYYSLAQAEKKKYEASKMNLTISGDGTEAAAATGGAAGAQKPPPLHDAEFSESLQLVDVEYDLAKQFSNYIQGLQVRVRTPPRKDKSSAYETEQVLLSGYQRVLLIDYDYLMAERRRLKTKFRGWVQTVTTVTFLIRLVRPDFRMHVARKMIVDKRPRASSAASYAELAEFPVTYIPVASVRANTVELLRSLRKGMLVDMDDGSLTKDQITLEVLGGQDMYIPPRYSRHDVPVEDDQNDLHVRISEVRENDDPDSAPRPFGLRHNHEGIGAASHIRCCRVRYDGDTVLDGMEQCIFPRRMWVSYILRHVVWGTIKDTVWSFFSRSRKRAQANRLITDAEVDQLIREHFVAPGRGISCRFDELVRNFRMFIAKKAHKRHWRVVNLEERIFQEVITFLERFPGALSPLDKRELEGYKYTPQPVDTLRVRLPNSVRMLAELLAQNAHEVWAVGRMDQGWRWGPARDNEKLLHPDLIPYEALTEETKQYDRDTSIEALKVITALGYVLEPPGRGDDQELDVEFGEPATEPGETYTPKPIPTDTIKVPPELRSLIELLAENTHEVWAKMRMSQGWKFGPKRDDNKLEHNGLVPYIYLTQEEKQMDRNTALQTVKLILRCGFKFVHKDKLTASSHRSGRKRSSQRGDRESSKVFGRSENPDAKHAADAVVLARSTARAKRAFLKHGSQRSFANRSSSGLSRGSSSGHLDSTGRHPMTINEDRQLEDSASSDDHSEVQSQSTQASASHQPHAESTSSSDSHGDESKSSLV